jgi:ABC-type spermidine/putrescine transport system permease subunit I
MGNKFSQDEFGNFYSVEGITRAVSLAITSVVTIGIAILVTLVVLVLGVWLAYVYLPPTWFKVLVIILLVDIALGIVIRAVYKRRRRS